MDNKKQCRHRAWNTLLTMERLTEDQKELTSAVVRQLVRLEECAAHHQNLEYFRPLIKNELGPLYKKIQTTPFITEEEKAQSTKFYWRQHYLINQALVSDLPFHSRMSYYFLIKPLFKVNYLLEQVIG